MFSKYFNRHLEPQHRTRPGVEPVCDGVKLFLTMHRQVRSLGQILADQTIGVFIAAAPARAVGSAKYTRTPVRSVSSLCRLISALIVRQGLPQ